MKSGGPAKKEAAVSFQMGDGRHCGGPMAGGWWGGEVLWTEVPLTGSCLWPGRN